MRYTLVEGQSECLNNGKIQELLIDMPLLSRYELPPSGEVIQTEITTMGYCIQRIIDQIRRDTTPSKICPELVTKIRHVLLELLSNSHDSFIRKYWGLPDHTSAIVRLRYKIDRTRGTVRLLLLDTGIWKNTHTFTDLQGKCFWWKWLWLHNCHIATNWAFKSKFFSKWASAVASFYL